MVLTRNGVPDIVRLLFSRADLILKPLVLGELSCQTSQPPEALRAAFGKV